MGLVVESLRMGCAVFAQTDGTTLQVNVASDVSETKNRNWKLRNIFITYFTRLRILYYTLYYTILYTLLPL